MILKSEQEIVNCHFCSADGHYEVTLMTKATVHSNGLVIWQPPAVYKSSCSIDVEYFPYDVQTCILKLGSWTYDGFKVLIFLLFLLFNCIYLLLQQLLKQLSAYIHNYSINQLDNKNLFLINQIHEIFIVHLHHSKCIYICMYVLHQCIHTYICIYLHI